MAVIYDEVPEESSADLKYELLKNDGSGDLETAVPTSVSYKVGDKESGQVLRAATGLPLANSGWIPLTPADTKVVNADRENELHKVTVTAVYGPADQVNREYLFRVLNLQFVP